MMIAAHKLSKKFGSFVAVDSLDFRIREGEVIGFLGPNGAGKTTTIRMICGYLRPTAGSIEVDGQDVTTHCRAVQAKIGYLPESAPLYTEMRVREYLRFRARLFGFRGRAGREAADRAASRCWLDEVKHRPIGQLSKGYRQRVGLAGALLHEPPLLILDEPTSGLDPNQIREVRGLIRELAGQHTVLLSTHILPEVELTCDRIIMIAGGRLCASGTIDELRTTAAGESRYVLETDSQIARAALKQLPSVGAVEITPLESPWNRVLIGTANGSADLREQIAGAITGDGSRIRELRREAPSLESLFVRMMAQPQLLKENESSEAEAANA